MTSRLLSFFLFFISLILLPFNIVANEECLHVLDVVQIQDVTRTLDHFWPTMKSQLWRIMTKVAGTNPEAKFGLASFQDKKITGLSPSTRELTMLGNRTDYCVRLDAKLDKPHTGKITTVFQKYGARKDGGGGDKKEGVFEALYRVVLNPKVGWRSKTTNHRKVAKLAVIVTNGVSHLQGDVRALTGKRVRPFDLTLADLKMTKYDTNYDCDKVDYPSVQQVVELVKRNKAQVVVLASPCGKFDSRGRFIPCQDLAALNHKYHDSNGLMLWYRQQFHDADLHNVLVYELDSDMRNYAEVFNKAIDDVVAKDREEVQRGQRSLAELQKQLTELPALLEKEKSAIEQLGYNVVVLKHELRSEKRRELTQLKAKFNVVESALQQVLSALPDKCLSHLRRQEIRNQLTDGIANIQSFVRQLEAVLTSVNNVAS